MPNKPKMSEKQLTNQIIEALNYTGKYFCWRVNSGMLSAFHEGKKRMIRMAARGTSDIQGVRKRDGRMICVEVKLPETRKQVSDAQSLYLAKMKYYGALTGIAVSAEEAFIICEKAT